MVEVLKRGNVFVGHHCFQWLLGEVTIGIGGCPQLVKPFDSLHSGNHQVPGFSMVVQHWSPTIAPD